MVVGTVILWLANEVNASLEAGGNDDHGLSPWSTVRLIKSRVLNTQSALSKNSISLGSFNQLGNCTSMATIPGDFSTFLVSGEHGKVFKVARFGESNAPKTLASIDQEVSMVDVKVLEASNAQNRLFDFDLAFRNVVTSMHVTVIKSPVPSSKGVASKSFEGSKEATDDNRQQQQVSGSGSSTGTSNDKVLLLVGRSDGSVELYDTSKSVPIYKWNVNFLANSGVNVVGVALVRWNANRKSSFFVADVAGNLFLFDLLAANPQLPVQTDLIDSNLSTQLADVATAGCYGEGVVPLLALPAHFVDISSSRPGSKVCYATVVESTSAAGSSRSSSKKQKGPSRSDSSSRIKIRQIRGDLFATMKTTDDDQELNLRLWRLVDNQLSAVSMPSEHVFDLSWMSNDLSDVSEGLTAAGSGSRSRK